MKKDIADRDDIVKLVTLFYKKLLSDKSISYLFTDIAKIELVPHLDVLADFWENILFQKDTYRKNAMQPHLVLHQKSTLNKQHFNTWLNYFNETVDEFFIGEKATLAKEKALSIATVMQIKIIQSGSGIGNQ